VRGQDRYRNLIHEPRLASDLDPDAVAFHLKNYDVQMNILYASATAQPDRKRWG
jgi:hypothetical protein